MRARRLQKAPLALGVMAAMLGVSAPAWAEWEGVLPTEPLMPRWTWEQLRAEQRLQQMTPEEAREAERIRQQGREVGRQVGREEAVPKRVRPITPSPRRGQLSEAEMNANPVAAAGEHIRMARQSLQDNDWEAANKHVMQAEAQLRRIGTGGNAQVRRYLQSLEKDLQQAQERINVRGRDADGRLENIETRIRAMTPSEAGPEERPE